MAFHAHQMLEAGVRQFRESGCRRRGSAYRDRRCTISGSAFPTARAYLQTAEIVSRLMRGGELHCEVQVAIAQKSCPVLRRPIQPGGDP